MEEIAVSKEVLQSLEGLGFTETVIGDKRGSIRQYRNSNRLHVREYDDKFVIHRDKVDPRVDPVGHLVRDSPESLLAFGASLFLLHAKGGRRTDSEGEHTRSDSSSSSSSPSFSLNPFLFLITFLSLNRILGKIKRLLF